MSSRHPPLNFLLQTLQLITFSALCGALCVAQRPVADKVVSTDSPPNSENSRRTRDVLDELQQAAIKRSSIFEITESDLNLHLNRIVKGRISASASRFANYESISLRLHTGEASATLHWRVLGRPRTVTFTFKIDRLDDRFRITLLGGSYGHLHVPRGLLRPMLPALESLGQALQGEIQALFQMNQIQVAEGRLLIDPRFP